LVEPRERLKALQLQAKRARRGNERNVRNVFASSRFTVAHRDARNRRGGNPDFDFYYGFDAARDASPSSFAAVDAPTPNLTIPNSNHYHRSNHVLVVSSFSTTFSVLAFVRRLRLRRSARLVSASTLYPSFPPRSSTSAAVTPTPRASPPPPPLSRARTRSRSIFHPPSPCPCCTSTRLCLCTTSPSSP